MAFVPYSYDDGQPMPFEYYKLARDGDIQIGLCLALTEGTLGVSAEPGYISMREEAGAKAGSTIPVIRVSGKVLFEAPLAAADETLTAGGLAGVSGDGLGIDPAAGVKNIEIVDMDGSAAGDKCRCRFLG